MSYLTQSDVSRVFFELMYQATTDREALVRSVRAQIAQARAELAAAGAAEEDEEAE